MDRDNEVRRTGTQTVRTVLVALLCTFAFGAQAQTRLPKNTLGAPLTLQDEGSFFVNGEIVTAAFPEAPGNRAPVAGKVMVNQMYVHYRLPVARDRYPVVMVHGGGLTGQTFETTPDGREGWATYFTRRGYPVYVVDIPGRGRAGFDPGMINKGKAQNDAGLVPEITRTTEDFAWTTFRFGPKPGVAYPDGKFPLDHMDGFHAQGVPYAEVTLEGGAPVQGPKALAALLDQIGPAILVVHSRAGPFADAVVATRPGLVKAVINVEGHQSPAPSAAQIAAYRTVPDLEVFGDHVEGNPVSTGQVRLDARTKVANEINAAGGKAQVLQLPSVGMAGNSHMVMQDSNSLQVADLLLKWLDEVVTGKAAAD
jgi:pimeloyl-ACP methyl ester carboxylesterase